MSIIESTLREIVTACNATLLHIHFHHFTPNGGVSGVAVLSESHISIHSWPEKYYAALDIFMCGSSQPEKSLAVLQRVFEPTHLYVNEQMRGATYAK
jgi:S-adenosylmethionine decarboxylase